MNRREFIKTGSGAFFIAAAGRAFGDGAPSNRVRLAIMGCHANGRGYAIMKATIGLPGIEYACVCDVDSRARAAAAQLVKDMTGVTPRIEKDFRKVLEDPTIDGFVVATPDHWHAPAANLIMKAGKAVYVEKPCCFCPREGEILIETQRKTGMVFQMGNQRRSVKAMDEAQAKIRAGIIGEPRWAKCWYSTRRAPIGIGKVVPVPEWLDWDLWQGPAPRAEFKDNLVHYNWHWRRRYGTGECGNNAVHYIDDARRAIQGVWPELVTSTGGRLVHSGDDWEWFDCQNATWRFPGGKMITWEGSSSMRMNAGEAQDGCVVYGLEGAVKFVDAAITHYDLKGKAVEQWPVQTVSSEDRTGAGDPMTISHVKRYVEAVRAQDPKLSCSPVEEGVRTTFLCHAANIAQTTGETVRIDPATGKLVNGSAAAEALWSREYEPGWEMKA